MSINNPKQKEIICLHTHRNMDILLATMKSSPRHNLNIKRARKCDYLLFSLNMDSELFKEFQHTVRVDAGMNLFQLPLGIGTIKHDEAFMICKISGIHKLSESDHSGIHQDDAFYEIKFKEYACITIPSLYKNKKNPVSYFPEDEILKLLNIDDFEDNNILEWTQENNVEPKYLDWGENDSEEFQQLANQRNIWEGYFRDDLDTFLQYEAFQIINSNGHLNRQVSIQKKLGDELGKSLTEPKFMKFNVDKQADQTIEPSDFTLTQIDDVKELSIDEAKIGLSRKYDIPIENIEVILKG